jgi:hypothetical protein
VLPPLGPETGRLPEGEHAASWDALLDRFGWTFADGSSSTRSTLSSSTSPTLARICDVAAALDVTITEQLSLRGPDAA